MSSSTEFREFIFKIERDVLEEIKNEAMNNILKMDAFSSGNMYRSFEIVGNEKTGYSLVNAAPYAELVDRGTSPHKINPTVLRRWIETKKREYGKDAELAEQRIARHIAKFGTSPKPFWRKAIHDVLVGKYAGQAELESEIEETGRD